ncbi:MAG: hypothetical protein WCA84_10440, partial [Ignavibacteriaceae bacterium]
FGFLINKITIFFLEVNAVSLRSTAFTSSPLLIIYTRLFTLPKLLETAWYVSTPGGVGGQRLCRFLPD